MGSDFSQNLPEDKTAFLVDDLRRAAVDSSGQIGSLYDARTNRIVHVHPRKQVPDLIQLEKKPTCKWRRGGSKYTDTSLNFSDMNDISPLSVYMDMAGKTYREYDHPVDYDKPIGEQTRFLFYASECFEQMLPRSRTDTLKYFLDGTFNRLNVDATHIVHRITWGFEVVLIIQLPTDVPDCDADRLLNKIYDILEHRKSETLLTDDDQKLWAKFDVHIMSEVPPLSFNPTDPIQSIVQCIRDFEIDYRHPLVYTLQPVEWIYAEKFDSFYNFIFYHAQQMSKPIQQLFFSIHSGLIESVISYPQMQNTRRILPEDSRRRRPIQVHHDIAVSEHKHASLNSTKRDLYIDENSPVYKTASTTADLQSNQHKCIQVLDDDTLVFKGHQENIIYDRHPSDPTFSPTDKWNARDDQRHTSLQGDCINAQNSDKNTHVSSNCQQGMREASHLIEINVLLVGESGVGKSTFINAFVNYLTFGTLQQAEQGEPVVLIPVSFITTVGDQFEEVLVKFGDADSNEDYDHPGQSVTQQCKSYTFNVRNQFLLRLIDTPGMGDTRGLAQDDKNIDHIISFIKTLPHLNTVCLLLKPNATRLNVFMRSCITQLATFLTPSARNNIVFSFTNTRATFFSPGNTAPLLKSMLNELSNVNIPFSKTNTFCFDSESFRYLTARKWGIPFDEFQTSDYRNSWIRSVAESERLLRHIRSLAPFHMVEWQSKLDNTVKAT